MDSPPPVQTLLVSDFRKERQPGSWEAPAGFFKKIIKDGFFLMGLTEKITVFSNRTIAKNASIVLATPIYLGKCGPETKFWVDLNASGGGITSIRYQVGDTSDDTFYTPPSAVSICASFKSSIGTASRDRFGASLLGSVWMKFKAKELNASPVVLDMGLIISQN